MYIYVYIYTYLCIFMNIYMYTWERGPTYIQKRPIHVDKEVQYIHMSIYIKETYACWKKSPIYIYICLYIYTPGSERPHGPGGLCWIWKNHQNPYYSCRCVCVCVSVCVCLCMYVCVCVCVCVCVYERVRTTEEKGRASAKSSKNKTTPPLPSRSRVRVSKWVRAKRKNHQIPYYSCRCVCERETHICARAREGEHHQVVEVCVRNEMRERVRYIYIDIYIYTYRTLEMRERVRYIYEMRERVRESWRYVCERERVCYRERVRESCRYVWEIKSEKGGDKLCIAHIWYVLYVLSSGCSWTSVL